MILLRKAENHTTEKLIRPKTYLAENPVGLLVVFYVFIFFLIAKKKMYATIDTCIDYKYVWKNWLNRYTTVTYIAF